MTHATRITVTKAGVRIGAAYLPKPPAPSKDAEVIQAAFLSERLQRRLLDLEPPVLPTRWFVAICLALGYAGYRFAFMVPA